MPRPYQPISFANEFILKAAPEGASHMKLQKLVYCAHGWWLTANEEPILSEEPEVWRHGPVFHSLYTALSGFGSNNITTCQSLVFGQMPRVDPDDDQVLGLIEFIWGRYGGMSAFKLSDMTHKEGTPWQQTAERHNYLLPMHTKIDRGLIRNEFKRIAESDPTQ